MLPNASFQFAFTNPPGVPASVIAATNPALPLSDWTPLAGVTETSPGRFLFTLPQAISNGASFYRVRSP
jgi:hypothetical protein